MPPQKIRQAGAASKAKAPKPTVRDMWRMDQLARKLGATIPQTKWKRIQTTTKVGEKPSLHWLGYLSLSVADVEAEFSSKIPIKDRGEAEDAIAREVISMLESDEVEFSVKEATKRIVCRRDLLKDDQDLCKADMRSSSLSAWEREAKLCSLHPREFRWSRRSHAIAYGTSFAKELVEAFGRLHISNKISRSFIERFCTLMHRVTIQRLPVEKRSKELPDWNGPAYTLQEQEITYLQEWATGLANVYGRYTDARASTCDTDIPIFLGIVAAKEFRDLAYCPVELVKSFCNAIQTTAIALLDGDKVGPTIVHKDPGQSSGKGGRNPTMTRVGPAKYVTKGVSHVSQPSIDTDLSRKPIKATIDSDNAVKIGERKIKGTCVSTSQHQVGATLETIPETTTVVLHSDHELSEPALTHANDYEKVDAFMLRKPAPAKWPWMKSSRFNNDSHSNLNTAQDITSKGHKEPIPTDLSPQDMQQISHISSLITKINVTSIDHAQRVAEIFAFNICLQTNVISLQDAQLFLESIKKGALKELLGRQDMQRGVRKNASNHSRLSESELHHITVACIKLPNLLKPINAGRLRAVGHALGAYIVRALHWVPFVELYQISSAFQKEVEDSLADRCQLETTDEEDSVMRENNADFSTGGGINVPASIVRLVAPGGTMDIPFPKSFVKHIYRTCNTAYDRTVRSSSKRKAEEDLDVESKRVC